MEPEYQENFFEAHDGLSLFFRKWVPADAKGLVALVHGFGEHSGRYLKLAESLGEAHWAVSAFDYRGHGQSGGRRAHVDSFDDYLRDVDAFLAENKRQGLPKPILLGHSLGGLIVARYCERKIEDVAAVVLSSPFLRMAINLPRTKAMLGTLLSGLVPTLSVKTNLDPYVLSHDKSMVEEYTADPLVSNVASARWFTEVTKTQDKVLADAKKFQHPLLSLNAGEDFISSLAGTKKFFKAAASPQKIIKIYDGFYHEIFNEIDRARVIKDLGDWLENFRNS